MSPDELNLLSACRGPCDLCLELPAHVSASCERCREPGAAHLTSRLVAALTGDFAVFCVLMVERLPSVCRGHAAGHISHVHLPQEAASPTQEEEEEEKSEHG